MELGGLHNHTHKPVKTDANVRTRSLKRGMCPGPVAGPPCGNKCYEVTVRFFCFRQYTPLTIPNYVSNGRCLLCNPAPVSPSAPPISQQTSPSSSSTPTMTPTSSSSLAPQVPPTGSTTLPTQHHPSSVPLPATLQIQQSSEFKKPLQITADMDIATIISTMNANPGSETIQEQGCRALYNLADKGGIFRTWYNLAFGNSSNKKTIADKGGIDVIVNAMKNPKFLNHADIQEYGCRALANLAAGSAKNQKTIAEKGGMDRIVNAMKNPRFLNHAGIQEYGCWALTNLAVDSANQKTIAEKGGIDVIVNAMKNPRFLNHAGIQNMVVEHLIISLSTVRIRRRLLRRAELMSL